MISFFIPDFNFSSSSHPELPHLPIEPLPLHFRRFCPCHIFYSVFFSLTEKKKRAEDLRLPVSLDQLRGSNS